MKLSNINIDTFCSNMVFRGTNRDFGKKTAVIDNPTVLIDTLNNLANLNAPLVNASDDKVDLERYARKDLRSSAQAESIIMKYPQTSRYIGSLPYKWLEDVPEEDRKAYTDRVFELFSDFAKKVSCPRESYPGDYVKQIEEFSADLEHITGKKSKAAYLNQGTIGRAYKFSVGDDDFVVKTFFTNPLALGYYSRHGKGAEILSAVYAKYNAPKGDFADFYFGKFAGKDDLDGFIVTKFIDYDNAKVSYTKNLVLDRVSKHPVTCNNIVNNTVADTVVDYGEIRKGQLSSKRQYKIQRLIMQAVLSEDIDKLNEICRKYEGPDLDSVLYGLKESFNFYILHSNYYNDVDILGADEIKILTSDRYNRLFKLLFEAINNYDDKSYKVILDKYAGTDELEYVLRLYNNKMSEEQREIFARRIRKTEIMRLANVFKDAGII